MPDPEDAVTDPEGERLQPAVEPPAAPKQPPTKYVVLEERELPHSTPDTSNHPLNDNDTADVVVYVKIGEAEVHGGDTRAIEAVLKKLGRSGEDKGAFHAVPARSWNRRTPKVETITKQRIV